MKQAEYPTEQLFFRQQAEKILSSNPEDDKTANFLTAQDLQREYVLQKIMLALQQEKINELYAGANNGYPNAARANNNLQYNSAENSPPPNNTTIDNIYNDNAFWPGNTTMEINVIEKLASQQRFIKGITDNAPCLMSYWRNDLVCTFTNQTAKEWLGTELKDIVGHNMKDVLGDELFANNYPYIKRALQGEKVQFETGGFMIHGSPGNIWIQYVPDIENGEVKGFYSLVTDITALKQTQSAIDFEATDKEALINSSRDYMCSIDRDYKILTANTAYKNLFESVTGVPVRKGDDVKTGSGFDDATWRLWEGFFERALSGESFTVETFTKAENLDWEIWTECSFTPIVQYGEITGLACYSRDITERKKAAAALKNSEGKLKALVQNISDIITLVDETGTIKYVSSSVTQIMGYNDHELLGSNMFALIHPDDYTLAFGELQKALLQPGYTAELEIKLLHKDGRYIYIEARGSNQLHNPLLSAILINCRDITERKAGEQAIAESYKKLEDYKFALDQASMVFIMDDGDAFTYVNDNFCSITKYSREELVGNSSKMLQSDYHSTAFVNDLWKTIKSGKVWHSRMKGKAKDSTYFWVDTTIIPFIDGSGKPYKYLAINSDITQTKLAEEALILSNERFEYVLDATFDAIWDLDNITGKIFWGEGYKKLFGYEPGSSFYEAQRDFYPKIHPGDFDNFIKNFQAALNSNASHWSAEYRFLKANNEYAYVADKALIIRNEQGQHVRLIGAMQDITERMKAAAELEKSELKFRSMVHNINDVITLVDEKGFVLYASPSLKPVLGYEPEEVNGLKLFTLIHPEDYAAAKDVFRGLLATQGNGGIIEFRYRHNNGHYLIMEAQGNSQLHNPTINAVILTTRDITKRKEKEEERMELVYELMEKNADLKQFSYITSHNLRAPLTNLMAICNLLDTEGLTPDDTLQLINAFKISTAKLSETLDDLIKILIIKDGKSQEVESIYFDKALEDVKNSVSGMIDESGAIIHADFSGGASVPFYKAYMESILLNLLTNALKYAYPGRKPVIAIQTREEEKFVVFTFMDNGIGMDLKRVKNKIFGLYQRFHNKIDGKGIGLYLVHSQVTTLGGTITVDSTEGEGTTFVIRFKKDLFKKM